MISNTLINEAIIYILDHAGENISIDDVASYCGLSKFYFSRLFKKETGESVYAFIKRTTIEHSAFRLKIEPQKTVTDIGLDFGYSPSNYSSAFRQRYSIPPVYFRRSLQSKPGKKASFSEYASKITIQELPPYRVIYERTIGSYNNLGVEWCAFIEKYKQYITDETLLLERTMDDPSITTDGRCLYDICITIEENAECALPNICTFPGGPFAVYRFKGYAQQIYAEFQNVLTVWLPNSGWNIDDRYSYDIYRSISEETGFMVIDFCIPVTKTAYSFLEDDKS